MTAHGLAFKESLNLQFNAASARLLPSQWIPQNTTLRTKPFSFVGHEYQLAIVDDKHRQVATKKCAQIGFTEIFIRWGLCFLVQHPGCQIIFTQPTDTDASRFSKQRVDVIFEDSPIVNKLGTGGIDSVSLKRVGTSFMNLRGTFGAKAAISVPSDANIYDEINFSNPRVLSQFKSRLQHSEYKFERHVSTPTIPNYGVSGLFELSDQKSLLLKCHHCGHYQPLTWEDNFFFKPQKGGTVLPKNQETFETYLAQEWDYDVFIGCSSCGREVDRSWEGGRREWVAAFPERARDLDTGLSGYQIGQPDVSFVSPADIVKASDPRFPNGYSKTQDFYNFVLGRDLPGGDGMKIDAAVRALCTIHMNTPTVASGTFLGIDLGKTCHMVVLKDMWIPESNNAVPVVIAALEFSRDILAEMIVKCMKRFGALYTVSDAQPYTTTVEAVAKQHNERMSICYFGGKKSYTQSGVQVTANRTMMLDGVTETLPKREMLVIDGLENAEVFWKHLENLVKVKIEDDDGTETYEYVKVGPDHYGYALGYAKLARLMFHEVAQKESKFGPVEISGAKSTL